MTGAFADAQTGIASTASAHIALKPNMFPSPFTVSTLDSEGVADQAKPQAPGGPAIFPSADNRRDIVGGIAVDVEIVGVDAGMGRAAVGDEAQQLPAGVDGAGFQF